MKHGLFANINLVLVLMLISGCTLFEFASTKTETTAAPAATADPVVRNGDNELKARVAELEQRVKVLEEKLQGQW